MAPNDVICTRWQCSYSGFFASFVHNRIKWRCATHVFYLNAGNTLIVHCSTSTGDIFTGVAIVGHGIANFIDWQVIQMSKTDVPCIALL